MRRRLRCAIVPALLLAVLNACSDPPQPRTPAATASPGARPAPGTAAHHPLPVDTTDSAIVDFDSAVFDPGTLRAGDSVAGLAVVAVDVERVFENTEWVGSVRFAGRTVLNGVYLRHFDYPEPRLHCFHASEPTASRLPRFPHPDTANPLKTWFCFTNQDSAAAFLGDAARPRAASIEIDDYTAVRFFSDAFATARLVRVLRAGPDTVDTLREPRPPR